MPLITCEECGKEISSRADSCPNCGCPSEYAFESHQKEQEEKERKRKEEEQIQEAEEQESKEWERKEKEWKEYALKEAMREKEKELKRKKQEKKERDNIMVPNPLAAVILIFVVIMFVKFVEPQSYFKQVEEMERYARSHNEIGSSWERGYNELAASMEITGSIERLEQEDLKQWVGVLRSFGKFHKADSALRSEIARENAEYEQVARYTIIGRALDYIGFNSVDQEIAQETADEQKALSRSVEELRMQVLKLAQTLNRTGASGIITFQQRRNMRTGVLVEQRHDRNIMTASGHELKIIVVRLLSEETFVENAAQVALLTGLRSLEREIGNQDWWIRESIRR